jgi:hypothetical protein
MDFPHGANRTSLGVEGLRALPSPGGSLSPEFTLFAETFLNKLDENFIVIVLKQIPAPVHLGSE